MINREDYNGHTPGPWRHDDYSETYIWGPDNEMVGETRGTGAGLPQKINGKLMADAPILLAEVIRLQDEIVRLTSLIPSDIK